MQLVGRMAIQHFDLGYTCYSIGCSYVAFTFITVWLAGRLTVNRLITLEQSVSCMLIDCTAAGVRVTAKLYLIAERGKLISDSIAAAVLPATEHLLPTDDRLGLNTIPVHILCSSIHILSYWPYICPAHFLHLLAPTPNIPTVIVFLLWNCIARYCCRDSRFCLSVCPSIRLSRVDCNKTEWCTVDILIPHERAVTLLFWH